ncbi:unnamed protein product [Rotaria sordida]|uniref:Uncharacterized protein n=1 Tax=Rotaria sordida TaxID=392033 RepID=A0A815TME0_9BILA|nr:unnamed protein product [Rotaria sordida]CAF4127561.1 unnamed protein product [Rotaria sordida]
MEYVGGLISIVTKGKKVLDILKSFHNSDIQMSAGKDDWSRTENKVLFKADERCIRSFFAQARYYGRNPVAQKDIIDYLKFVSEKFHSKYEISMVITCLKKKTLWLEDEDSMVPHQSEIEVMELKLTYIVN